MKYIVFVSFLIVALLGCNKMEKPADLLSGSRAMVINGESNSLSVIDLSTHQVRGNYEFKKGSWPHHIYLNSDGSLAVVSLTGVDLSGGHAGHGGGDESWVLAFQTDDFKVVNCKKLEYVAHNALFAKNDQEIWVPQMDENGFILRLDSKNFKELGRIEVGSGPLEITTDVNKEFVFVANGEANTISVINVETASVLKTISVGDEPVGAWPGKNQKMYVDCEVSKEIFELDVNTLEISESFVLDFTPAYVLYLSAVNQLWVSDATNGGVHSYQFISDEWVESGYIETGANAHALVADDSEETVYITNQGSNTVSVIDVLSFTKTADIPVEGKPNGIVLKY